MTVLKKRFRDNAGAPARREKRSMTEEVFYDMMHGEQVKKYASHLSDACNGRPEE